MQEELNEAIKGTPMEEEKLRVEKLRQFKDTVGYKELVNAARDNEANLMRLFLSDEVVDLQQLRADFRAWHKLIQMVDEPVIAYDNWVEMTLKQMRIQETNSMSQGAYHGR